MRRFRRATGIASDQFVSRGDTTVVDAYLSPILRSYVAQVAGELGADGAEAIRLMFMMSSGRTDGSP